ncbi:MAG: hypothetical protein KGQ61_04605 [Planctomycetes bacterium]|nr:hypothetical protein [Planctomycetota bacterium]
MTDPVAPQPQAPTGAVPSGGAAHRPAPARGKLHRVGRIALLLAGIAMVALGVAPWFLGQPARLSSLVARALPALRADVTFGRVRLGWLVPPVFENVRVEPRDGSRAPLSIERIEGSYGLAAMLFTGGDLGRFHVSGAELDVVFDADRESNLSRVVAPAPAAAGPAAPGGPQRSPVHLRLDFDDAVVKVSGPWAEGVWTSSPIDFQAGIERAPNAAHSDLVLGRTRLLDDSRLDPNVAQGVLAYVAPILADTTRTAGRFSLQVDEVRLPLGAAEEGTLSGELTMHAVDLGPGPLVTDILAALPGRLDAPPAIRIADDSRIAFRMADRKVWHEGLRFGVPLPGPARRLDITSAGSVALDDGALDLKLSLPLPEQLPGDRPLLSAMAGKTVSLGVGGELGTPKVNFDGSLRRFAGDVVVDLIDRVAGQGRVRGQGPLLPAPAPAGAATARTVPPPPAPGWSGPRDDADATEAREPGRLPAGDDVEPLALPAPRSGGGAATPPPPRPQWNGPGDAAAAGSTAGQPRPSGTADRLDQLKDRLPPEVAGNPSTDKLIDLVGGVIDELARRRAERAAAEAAAPPGSEPPPATQPRRGRLLRRFLGPTAPPPSPAPAP